MKIGSRSHRVTVVIWLMTSLLLFSILFTIRLEPANAQDSLPPDHIDGLSSIKYANSYWSVAELRTTDAVNRDCRTVTVCSSVIVLEVILTNADRNRISFNISDLTLTSIQQADVEAARFDCSFSNIIKDLSQEYGEIFRDCPKRKDLMSVDSLQTKVFSIVFFAESPTISPGNTLNLEINEEYLPMALPVKLPLAEIE